MASVARSQPSPDDSAGFRPDIEGLRALAVGAVLGFHFFPSYFPGGYFGVDVFFVISGYLITGVIVRRAGPGRFNLLDFYARRIRRLFPAMLVVIAACLVAAVVLMFSFELERFARHVTAALLYVENFNLASELGYFDHDARAKPLLHFWSLAVEEQFYLVWPLLVLLLARGRGPRALLLAAAISAASLIYTLGPAHDPARLFFDPLARAWELGLGAILATWPRTGDELRPGRARDIVSLACVAVLAGCAFWTVPQALHPGWATILPVVATAGAIACGSASLANRTVLALPPAQFAGRISYALYLWHWPLLAFPFFVAGDNPGAAVRLGLLALAIVLAAATWLFVERPLRRRGNVRRLAALLLAGAIGLLAATWIAVAVAKANPDARQAGIEAQLEGPMWAFVSNRACMARYELPPGHPFCMLSRNAEPTLALAGNSHANHLYYGLASDARSRGHAILSYGSCNLMDGADSPACRMQITALRSAPRLRAIVVSMMWPAFGPDGAMLDPVTRRPPGPNAPDAKGFERRVNAWLDAINPAGVPVVIAGPKPEMSYDVADCFARPFRAAAETCRLGPDSAARDISETSTMLRRIAAARPNTTYVEISDLFCRNDACDYLADDGRPFLRDQNHLSRLGSALVASRILDAGPADLRKPH